MMMSEKVHVDNVAILSGKHTKTPLDTLFLSGIQSPFEPPNEWIVPVYEDAFHHKYPWKLSHLSPLDANNENCPLHCYCNVT